MSYPPSEHGDAAQTPDPAAQATPGDPDSSAPTTPLESGPAPAGYAPGQAAIPPPAGEPTTAPFGATPPPYTPAPLPYAAPQPAAARRGPAVPILLTLTILFFLAAGGMATLYVMQKSDSDAAIARQRAEIATLKQDVATKTDEATKASSDLRTAQGRAEEATKRADTLQTQTTKLTACQKAVQDFFAALRANDEAAGTRAVLAIQASCEGVTIT